LGVPLPPPFAPACRIDSTLPVLVPIRTEIMADPLTEAEIRFRALQSYQATVRSLAADGERQVMRYFYRQPGWVRMEFVQPYPGTVMTYDPGTRRVHIWPFGRTLMPALSVAPDSALLRNQRGHRIDRSDVGALLANLRALSARGSISLLGDTQVAGQPATGWDIVGEAGVSVADVHRYRVWLALDTLFPLRVESFALGDRLIETVEMEAVQTDVRFAERFFTP
jgi:outer membrane lipoprotein-sorting protein